MIIIVKLTPQGEIAQIMRSTRSKYHYAIRYVKKKKKL